MVLGEVRHNGVGFLLGVAAFLGAVAVVVGMLTLLRAHQRETQKMMAQKEADVRSRAAEAEAGVRRAMEKLGFSAVILPRDQNLGDFYAFDYAAKTLPETSAATLREAGVQTLQRLVPVLRMCFEWPERKRVVLVAGVSDDAKDLPGEDRDRFVEPVALGQVSLGREIHSSLGLHVGDSIEIQGKPFAVAKCDRERGDKDDVTVWMNLHDAQALLSQEGRINEILAVQAPEAWNDLPRVREEIARLLPDAQAVARSAKTVTTAWAVRNALKEEESALERERVEREGVLGAESRTFGLLGSLAIGLAAVWVALVCWGNLRARQAEIGILRTLGFRSSQILALFLGRPVLMALVGGVAGVLVGRFGVPPVAGLAHLPLVWADLGMLAGAVAGALVVGTLAGAVPALAAARRDPARILAREG
jgi:ABC-type lipoprotein release transport system permease subunit